MSLLKRLFTHSLRRPHTSAHTHEHHREAALRDTVASRLLSRRLTVPRAVLRLGLCVSQIASPALLCTRSTDRHTRCPHAGNPILSIQTMSADRALQLVAALLPLFTSLPSGALADPVAIGCGDIGAAAMVHGQPSAISISTVGAFVLLSSGLPHVLAQSTAQASTLSPTGFKPPRPQHREPRAPPTVGWIDTVEDPIDVRVRSRRCSSHDQCGYDASAETHTYCDNAMNCYQ